MTAIHSEPSPLAGKTMQIVDPDPLSGSKIVIEDWWDRIAGKSWMVCDNNLACLDYAIRTAGLSTFSDEVVYGKIESSGKLVHVDHLAEVSA
jgi:hypothetical protein